MISSPYVWQTAAGVISLLNDYLISKGKSPLGFLNPMIYSTGAIGFNDITSGSNPGCGTSGFSAAKGWDPVSQKNTIRSIAALLIVPTGHGPRDTQLPEVAGHLLEGLADHFETGWKLALHYNIIGVLFTVISLDVELAT